MKRLRPRGISERSENGKWKENDKKRKCTKMGNEREHNQKQKKIGVSERR